MVAAASRIQRRPSMRSLEGCTGVGARVAVIDSGVQRGHPHIIAGRILPGIGILADGTVIHGEEATLDRLGHGTAVTAAIQEKAPDADIVPVRVFHDALRTSSRALVAAIEWSLAAGADIINLSLGTANPAHRALFAPLVARVTGQGALIVAAREAQGEPCWPGAIEGALGVALDWDVPRECWRVEEGIVRASGYPRPIAGIPQRRNLYGISFAAAQVSGFAARAFEASRGSVDPRAALISKMLRQNVTVA
jgi:subtilisin family serine protease